MPVKKIYPERKSKGKTKIKKVDKHVRTEIKEAVEKIPGLIFEHVRLQTRKEETDSASSLQAAIEPTTISQSQPEKVVMPYNYQEMQRKRWIMWTGVVVLTATIFAMWIVNAKLAFSDIKNGYTKPVPGITETAKKTWQETMQDTTKDNSIASKENLDNLKNQIKNNIISIFYAQQASTTTSTAN